MKKRVLITGSNKGIGKAIALSLDPNEYEAIIHYNSDKAGADQTSEELNQLGVENSILQFNNSNRSQCSEVIEQDIETNGSYYGVIYNAGIAKDNAFPALTDEDWDDVINTNLTGFYNVIKPITMPMVRTRKPGRIITISSVSGIAGNRGQVNYSASKAGLIGATKSLALELGKRNITVNCVAPGIIETDMTADLPAKEEILKSIPLKRFGKPEDVAGIVNFLLSDKANYITRQVISVNGGLV